MGYLIYSMETKTYFGRCNTGSKNKKHLKDYTYFAKETCERIINRNLNPQKFKVVELKQGDK